MDWESGIVRFNNCVRNLWWRYNWESLHDSVWIFFSNFWNKEGTHSWSCSTSQWMGELETLEAIASFGLFSSNIENWINQFSSFSVVTLGPVISGSTLSKYKVVWSEELTERSSSDWVHCSWLKIHKNGSWDVSSSGGFIEVNIDSFKLKIWVSVVRTSRVNSVFVRDDLPELGTDLITALTCLDVNDLSHEYFK